MPQHNFVDDYNHIYGRIIEISITGRENFIHFKCYSRQVIFEYSQSSDEEAQKLEKAFSDHINVLLEDRLWCEDKAACDLYASQATLRGFLWKLLVDANEIDSENYRRAIEERGPSFVYEKIKNDSSANTC